MLLLAGQTVHDKGKPETSSYWIDIKR